MYQLKGGNRPTYTAKFQIYMLSTSYCIEYNYICSINDILAYMGHNVSTVWYKMSNCFHICKELLEQSVPYVVLNGYVPGCTSYDTNMYHTMIGICHISGTENYFRLCSFKIFLNPIKGYIIPVQKRCVLS